MIQQMLSREQVMARAEARNVESFFQVFGDSIAVLAQLSSMERRDAKTIHDLDIFVEQWRGSNLVGGIVLTDKDGLAKFNSNVSGIPDVGMSLSDRDYFLWAKNSPEGKYVVGQPVTSRLGPTKGQIIVPVAAPLYQKGVFAGVLVASVKLHPLIERYLKLMKVSDQTEVYLVNQEGKPLYGSVPDAVGFENALKAKQEGRLQATYLDSKSGKPEDHLIASSPISLGSQNWLLIMSSVSQDAKDLTAFIQIRRTVILILTSAAILMFGIIVAQENKIKKVCKNNRT